MKTARAYLFLLICSLPLFGMATTGHAQSASQTPSQALEQEMRMLVSGMRAVAGCPALIEDWEYAVLADAASNVTYQVRKTYYLPATLKRSLYTKADANGCDSPVTKLEAAKLQAYAHSRWLGLSRAFLSEPACPQPSAGGLRFLKAFEKDVIETYQRKQVPGPSFGEIAAHAQNIAGNLRQACQGDSHYFRAQTTTLAPLQQMEISLLGQGIRQRDFDFNAGFTLGVGDAPDPHWARKSGVVAKRSLNGNRREVVAKYSACGGTPLPNPLGLTLEVKCIARLNAAGTLAVEIIPKNPKVKLASVTLDVLDLATGQPVASQMAKAAGTGRTAALNDALPLLQKAAPYHQVHIRLTLQTERRAPTPVHFHYAPDVKGPASVAAIDFVQAAQYAFAPKEKDLSAKGIVARNAKAYEADD